MVILYNLYILFAIQLQSEEYTYSMSEFVDSQPPDDDFDAFLKSAAQKERELQLDAVIRERATEAFAAVLEECGFTPLDEDPERYARLHQDIRADLRAQTTERYGNLPEDADQINRHFTQWAHTRMLEQAHFEAFVIRFTLDSAVWLEEQGIVWGRDSAEYDSALEYTLDGKREVFANMVMKRRFSAENPALRAMVTFLPGGPVQTDDVVMIPYFTKALEALSQEEHDSHRHIAATREVMDVLGIEQSPLDEPPNEKDEQFHTLLNIGLQARNRTRAEREELMYEAVAEVAPAFRPEEIYEIVQLAHREAEHTRGEDTPKTQD